ncbi:uncharacterized protein LOC123545477 [Mercenaria mercenaria]|uniref:uncharacterized protein LOC123545477 n=1 Tax=Mercenaria mercenaria TaxID=6596 RepID=UPI00234E7137|nr:uncharacterized protein LOC123545477 [Mercenaria mercenaria]
MGRKKRKQSWLATETDPKKKTAEDTEGRLNGASGGNKELHPRWLPYGSLAPRTKTKRNWKAKCISQTEENQLLRDENKQLQEKIKKYEDEQKRLQEVSEEHAARLVNLDNCDNVQIGNHNYLHVVQNNFDATFLKKLLDRYEDIIKEDARQRQVMKEQIQDLSSNIEKLTEARSKSEQMLDCLGHIVNQTELQQLTDQEEACPDSSIATMSQQITDLAKNFNAFCLSQRALSSVSLDERQFKSNGCKCQNKKRINSELDLNMHV